MTMKEQTPMTMNAFETITTDMLATVGGGVDNPWSSFVNLGKAAVNGAVNVINFFHDHPIEAGKFGTFAVHGGRVAKPFRDDPLSKAFIRKIAGTPHAAP